MNLKNKFILLMIMSLLLLISVGSVCASDADAALQAEPESQDTISVDNEYNTPVLSANNMEDADTLHGNSSKVDTEIISEDALKGDNETLNIDAKVKSSQGEEISVASGDIEVYNANKKLTTAYENSVITIKDKLKIGEYKLTINFKGNENYTASSKNITLTICGINTTKTSIDINSTNKGELELAITDGKNKYDYTVNDLTTVVTYKDGNDTKTINLKNVKVNNGKLIFSLANLNFTTATLNINYKGISVKNITINRIYNVDIQIINNKNPYKTGNFTFKVVDLDNNNKPVANAEVSLTTTGNIRAGFSAKTDKNGIATFKTTSLYEFTQGSSLTMNPLIIGRHTVTLGTKDNVKSKSKDISLVISKGSAKITVSKYNEPYGSEKNVTITVTNANDGTRLSNEVVYLYMPQTSGKGYYFATDSNGQCRINVKNLIPGTYSYKVALNNTGCINLNPVTGTITISKAAVVLNVINPKVFYNTGSTATVKITNKQTGKAVPNAIIKVNIYTGNSYTTYRYQADDNGIVAFQAPVSVGSHKVVVSLAESNYEPRFTASSVTKTVDVIRATAKFIAPKACYYYKEDGYFTLKLVNTRKNNEPIHNAQVNIKIYVGNSYYNYNGRTDGNGVIKIAANSFEPGSFKVVITCGDYNNYLAQQVTSQLIIKKTPGKITNTKVTAKQGEKKYLTVKVLNTQLNKVVPGIKLTVKVYTGNSYKTYTLTTQKSGCDYLITNMLSVGTHKVVIASADKNFYAPAVTTYITITK